MHEYDHFGLHILYLRFVEMWIFEQMAASAEFDLDLVADDWLQNLVL